MSVVRIQILRSLQLNPPQEIRIAGWLRTIRKSKGITFMTVNDGSNLSGIQVVIGDELLNENEGIQQLTTGAAVSVLGTLTESPAKGQRVEITAHEVKILGTAAADYPLQKKGHSYEFLRENAHLRNRTNTFGAVFRVRSKLAHAVHCFFQDRGFAYLHTPIITSSDTEGAGELFRVTTLDPIKPPKTPEGSVDWDKDFFARQTFLSVSGQLNGETFAMGMSDIYTFGPTFRAENSNTSRHVAEFWMIEPEMAFCDLALNCDMAEAFVKFLVRTLLEECEEDLAFFNQRVDKTLLTRLQELDSASFERMTYTEALERLLASGKSFEHPLSWGGNLQAEHERYLSETLVGRPVFLVDYPQEIKAFYMRRNDDQKTVAAMDLLVPGIGELIGGSQREERLDVLLAAIDRHKLDADSYSWYIDTRRYGTAPHAGFGLGFERMMMYVTGMQNIRDVIPFPRSPRNCEY